jgi:alkanesulfonate monooxygenase SsuD/methylene tetrahydromethanopterin reductase-like flavin-dependent oxidoreductase (luciferase family)
MDDSPRIQFAIGVPAINEYADVRLLADLAQDAESSGWDGFFIWDHLIYWEPEAQLVDPWVALTAIALATRRIRIGALVAAVARRRPWVLARQTATIDRLSGGRLVFGAGLGSMPAEYHSFGEDATNQVRASKLDEGLEILAGLWSADPFSFEGRHFRVEAVTMLPPPVQRPRVPIWVGGKWPHKGPFLRAARWDGVIPTHVTYGHGETMPPEDFGDVISFVAAQRDSEDPFEVALEGESPRGGWDAVRPYAEAGLTWWVEKLGWWRGPLGLTRTRILQGPPLPH